MIRNYALRLKRMESDGSRMVSKREGKRMTRKPRAISGSTLLAVTLVSCTFLAVGQTAQPTQSSLRRITTPLSLPHLYWHFLAYQNHLDTQATAMTMAGKDGAGMRNLLQRKLGFSDADYAPIRLSSGRLTAEVQALDSQAATIRAAGPSSTSFAQLSALTSQRETAINAEILYLKQNLSPAKVNVLEAFLAKLFSPGNAVPRPPSAVVQSGHAGVQQ
jgi:hypothetical protein